MGQESRPQEIRVFWLLDVIKHGEARWIAADDCFVGNQLFWSGGVQFGKEEVVARFQILGQNDIILAVFEDSIDKLRALISSADEEHGGTAWAFVLAILFLMAYKRLLYLWLVELERIFSWFGHFEFKNASVLFVDEEGLGIVAGFSLQKAVMDLKEILAKGVEGSVDNTDLVALMFVLKLFEFMARYYFGPESSVLSAGSTLPHLFAPGISQFDYFVMIAFDIFKQSRSYLN